MDNITTYDTPKGNVLEVRATPTKHKEVFTYEFILREKKPMGEQITLLMKADMHSPDYFTHKFLEEN